MGSKVVKPVVLAEDAAKVLKKSEMAAIQREFVALAKNSNLQKGKIDKASFIAMLEAQFGPLGGVVLERLFQVLDTNGNGTIDWDEFLVAMYVIYHGSRDAKMKLVFNLFDLDATGFLTRKQFQKISISLMQMQPDKKSAKADDEKAKELAPLAELYSFFAMYNYDRNNDKQLSYAEWRQIAEEDDVVLDLVYRMRRRELQSASGAGISAKPRVPAIGLPPSDRPASPVVVSAGAGAGVGAGAGAGAGSAAGSERPGSASAVERKSPRATGQPRG